jgi:hypothetical protein
MCALKRVSAGDRVSCWASGVMKMPIDAHPMLSGLLDPTTGTLFSGAPFSAAIGTSAAFWTATTDASFPNQAYIVTFSGSPGGFGFGVGRTPKNDLNPRVWCVRGYQGTQSP